MVGTNELQFEIRVLKHLLQPSYLSGSIVVLLAVLVVGSAVVSNIYLSTGWLADTLRTISNSDNHLLKGSTGDGSSPINVVLLFVFWAFVGLAVYFLVIGLGQALKEAREIEQEMNYVHGNRKAALRNFVQKLVTRVVGLTLIFVTVSIYLKTLLPYALSTARTTDLDLHGIFNIFVTGLVLVLVTHILVVLLRLVALRPRLFTSEIEA